jgi:hypothetical protein
LRVALHHRSVSAHALRGHKHGEANPDQNHADNRSNNPQPDSFIHP